MLGVQFLSRLEDWTVLDLIADGVLITAGCQM